ncbi:MAG: BatD family protein [Candidatus Cloacimonetes bacterium]|nr:BatD family protein [Candidatus Cloacimonadota bacterium]
MPHRYIIFAFTLAATWLCAAEFTVEAYVDNNRIGLSDAVQLTVEVTGEGSADKPILPEMDGFRVGGTSSGSSTSVSIVNGRMEKQTRRTFTFRLLPQRTGRLLIPPITVRGGNQSRTTKPIEVTVVEGSTQRVPVPQSQGSRGQQAQPDDLVEDNLFIRTELSKRNPYVGEPVSVTYTLYTRYDLSNISFGAEPSFTGFWKEDSFLADRIEFDAVNLEGRRYNAMKLRTVNLIPNKPGRQTIPPQEMAVDIVVQGRSFFDFGTTRRMQVKSDPLVIEVSTLPGEGRPANFSGAIGRFGIDSGISDSDLSAGEPFTYTLTIKGEGNFDNFTLPTTPGVNHIHFMEPEIERTVRGNSGKVTLRFPAYVEEEGSFRIPAVVFSFFDTNSRQYKTLRADEQTLRVQPADPALTQDNPYVFDQNVAGARRLSSDIDHIVYQAELSTDAPQLILDPRSSGDRLLFQRWWLWFLWILLPCTLAVSSWWAAHRRRLANDKAYTRQRQAGRILRKYLREAEKLTGDIGFYAAAQAGLANYLADKLRLPRGSTAESLLQALAERGAPDSLTAGLVTFLNRCNEARFMPGGFSAAHIAGDQEELRRLVQELSRWKEAK